MALENGFFQYVRQRTEPLAEKRDHDAAVGQWRAEHEFSSLAVKALATSNSNLLWRKTA
ncbi:hypothetical protein [Nitrosospira briensis]|uniref:hypothetical protein n=1 Tax=Nitrosospira briensis TaxID=35799 RepID=UPI0015A6309C|nr:hypothetical protein [Nitrosospira briensis]